MEATLPSGKKLDVPQIGFEPAAMLAEAVMDVLRLAGGMANPTQEAVGAATLTHPAVKAALKNILPSCIYDGVKLTPDAFDAPNLTASLRLDYFKILDTVVAEVTRPFFAATFSGSKESQPTTGDIPQP